MTTMTMSEILTPTVKNGWAIGAYDIPDLSVAMGVLEAALTDDSPVILMIYPGQVPMECYPTYVAFLKKEVERFGVNAAIVLDHGPSLVEVEAAVNAGFTGVMIDASKETIENNIAITKKAVELAHKVGVSVEAELGHVGLGSDVLPEDEMKSLYTRVEDAKRFVKETGVDALAVAIGTAHGLYKFEPRLDFERLALIRDEVDIPLVLHGSSGTPNDQLQKAVEFGINKVNVYTDIRMRVLNTIKQKVETDCIENYDILDLMNITRTDTRCVVQEKNLIFKSTGKGALYR